MTQSTTGARHRSACRPSTPLTVFGNAVVGSTGRRALAVVATSGLALTMGASTATAAPQVSNSGSGFGSLANVMLDADNDTVSTSPTVSVDADIEWEFVSATVTSEEPPPPPPPPAPEPAPAAAPERPTAEAAPASRDGERTEAPAEESSESAPAEEPQEQAAPASGSGAAAVDIGRRYIGTPYVWGGGSPSGFDCSGFTAYVYAQLGVSLPRSSGAQRNAGQVVSASEARPGDLVWWPGHVGIYTGNGNHIAARNPSQPLKEGPIYNGSPTFIRVLG